MVIGQNIKTLASSSKGNCIVIDDVMLDCGLPIKKIREGLDFNLSSVNSCILSHQHKDHSLAAKDLLKAGINLYCGPETAKAIDLTGARIVTPGEQFKAGAWKVKAFLVPHDVENLGYLLYNGKEKILFAVDCNYMPYNFRGLTHIFFGVDYDARILKENVMNGVIDVELGKRVIKNHMNIETALKFFRALDLGQAREIRLLHLSDNNSDAADFQRRVMAATGVPVYV